MGWETPTLGDIVEALPIQHYTPEEREEELTLFRARLAQVGVVAEVMDIQHLPSHLRYHVRPTGNTISANNYEQFISTLRQALPELKRTMGAISAEVFVSPQKPLVVQLLLRLPNSTPLSLSQMLRTRQFVESDARTTIPLGINLDQEIIAFPLEQLRHLLVVGTATTRFQVLSSILLSLAIFNTPAELRYALIGENTDPFDQFSQSPHVLGGTLTTMRELRRLLDGLVKHLGQRRQQFLLHNVTTLEQYNTTVNDAQNKPFPRLVIVIDTIPFEDEWSREREVWFSTVYRLVKEGPAVGIHVILTTNSLSSSTVPPQLLNLLKSQVVLKAEFHQVPNLPVIPLAFADAVLLGLNGGPVPLEVPVTDDKSLSALIRYWRQMNAKRTMAALAQGRQKSTGDTGLLTLRQDARLKTAVAKLRARQDSLSSEAETQEAHAVLPDQEKNRRQAGALAAYLGWLSVGPLMDVLDMSLDEAQHMIELLQSFSVLEGGPGPIWRFIRLDKRIG
jgi:hypothetical protein